MKYLPLREFEDVTSALNFDTADCHVIGGCDLYTTKAAGSDKKLYKHIETSLESQHESLLRLSASLSPPQAESLASSLNLSRSSPFGPLSQISSRRTFAYLIATLNASHPDYDFSHTLRPTDFRKERSIRAVINSIDTTIYNLRPRRSSYLSPQWSATSAKTGAQTPGGSQSWGPTMWTIIDSEMDLNQCAAYCYSPEEDPFDGEEGAIWSLNFFFFNKNRKRVCYLYLRGLSVISHSPVQAPMTPKRKGSARNSLNLSLGARKRARYWLGDKADSKELAGGYGDEDDLGVVIDEPGDDVVDADHDVDALDDLLRGESTGPDDDGSDVHPWEKGSVRAMSEQAVEDMEV